MSRTLNVRLPEALALWLKETAEQTGRTQGDLVRIHLEKAREASGEKPWMLLAGSVKGPRGLSMREGLGKR